MMNNLQIGILLPHNKELPEWEKGIINELNQNVAIQIAVFITTDPKPLLKKGIALNLFEKFESAWFRGLPDANRSSPVPANIATIDLKDKAVLAELKLDIIYKSSSSLNEEGLESFSRHGVWYFSFGLNKYRDALPIAYWEVMDDSPEIGCSLLVKRLNLPVEIIATSTTATVPYSVKNSFNMISWESGTLFIQRIRELINKGADLFFKEKEKQNIEIASQTPIAYPGNLKMSVLFIKNISRYFWHKISGLFTNKKFTLLFSQQAFNIQGLDLKKFIPLKLPSASFWADPFVIVNEEKTYVFFEEFINKNKRAHISVMELSNDGSHTKPITILEKPYHLSYPFIFNFEGTYYMIPESSENRTVELYKCKNFPLEWEFVQTLMEDVVLIDPTLLYHQDKWWLFGTRSSHSFTTTNNQLFLYYSESLFSTNWQSHPGNPISTLISNCRPAGKLFQKNGKLYRPAQNNASKQYGYGIKINEIEIINENEYREKEISEILPDSNNLQAVHTINFTNDTILMDGVLS